MSKGKVGGVTPFLRVALQVDATVMSELAIYVVGKLVSIVITLQLTLFTQLKCSFSIIVIFNCHHFATDSAHSENPHFLSLSFSIVVTLQLTILMQ